MADLTFADLRNVLPIEWMKEQITLYAELLGGIQVSSQYGGYHGVDEYEREKFAIIHAGMEDAGFVNGDPAANSQNMQAQFWLLVYQMASSTLHMWPFLHHHATAAERKEQDLRWANLVFAYLNGDYDDLPKVKQGDQLKIPANTPITSMSGAKFQVSKRAQTVTLHRVSDLSSRFIPGVVVNVSWAGAGGYWKDAYLHYFGSVR